MIKVIYDNMQKINSKNSNFYSSSYLYREIIQVKEYICLTIEEKLKEDGYLNHDEIEYILQDGLERLNLKKLNPEKMKKIMKVMWWIFATPNYSIIISANGKKDRSGIYSFSKEKVDEEFKEYIDVLIQRITSL